MTPERIQQIKARCEAATGSPWLYSENKHGQPATLYSEAELPEETDIAAFEKWDAYGYETEMIANAQFIIHARQDLPACIAEIERLQQIKR